MDTSVSEKLVASIFRIEVSRVRCSQSLWEWYMRALTKGAHATHQNYARRDNPVRPTKGTVEATWKIALFIVLQLGK
jgi:hypothetical protein